ncbi:hypothetical protein D3C86_1689910 [compost metagenome]
MARGNRISNTFSNIGAAVTKLVKTAPYHDLLHMCHISVYLNAPDGAFLSHCYVFSMTDEMDWLRETGDHHQ